MPTRRQPSRSKLPWPIPTVMVGLVLLGAPGSMGCRSRAHSDVYRQRMASEIRVLEDQLYDADYQNRVLRDKVWRLEKQSESTFDDTSSSPRRRPFLERATEPNSDPQPIQADPAFDVPALNDLNMEEPLIDQGIPASPEELEAPQIDMGIKEATESGDALRPPPGGPEPPGKEELQMPDVIPGEVLPPSANPDEDDKPAGQVPLQDAIQVKADQRPRQLRIHKSLSGGHQFEGEEELGGMFLVINAVDKLGRIVDLSQFDVEAELTIVALDPNLAPSEARIGRWEFSSDQVKRLVSDQPTSGLHVPLRWQETRPSGDQVTVHVRLRAEEDEMRCQSELQVAKKTNVAAWTPRSEKR
ncbi:MAG: hypothetical protein MI861_04180 [Pirellulales bacterium]|nr:hypothetical protein [Pirellulales bacterium]